MAKKQTLKELKALAAKAEQLQAENEQLKLKLVSKERDKKLTATKESKLYEELGRFAAAYQETQESGSAKRELYNSIILHLGHTLNTESFSRAVEILLAQSRGTYEHDPELVAHMAQEIVKGK
ncbi:hypothetical protein [Vibrio sp. WXL210]|uniref:hypothetical protein n=1 Tax=Vibrio sp. WXL210 TaxID=3450709 RepID=UPI003EC860A8